jgi:hypothetical protein
VIARSGFPHEIKGFAPTDRPIGQEFRKRSQMISQKRGLFAKSARFRPEKAPPNGGGASPIMENNPIKTRA